MSDAYDVIVIGLGAMGSATLDQLARRGVKALGLEQFGVPHDLGSSGGDTRLIRKAYFEHPDYVPLLQRAYANWDDLRARSGEQVLFRTGVTYIGQPGSEVIEGSLRSARLHALECRELSPETVAHESPLRVPPGYRALHEPEGGFVLAGKSIRLFCELSLGNGAEIRAAERVREWRETATGVEVTTSERSYHAARLVVTAGSWAGGLLPKLGVRLTVTRQVLFWLWPRSRERYALGTFPCWGAQVRGFPGMFYGFPMLPASMGGQLGLKVAHHAPGREILPGEAEAVSVAEVEPLREGLRDVFDADLGPVVASKTCMYTSTDDHHFVIDRYPGTERVFVACGFSGHGFKFASVIGEVLADFVTQGRTSLPIGFLGLGRFQ